MSDKKRVMLIMPHMVGGGAERVASLLMNSYAEKGCETEIVLTSDKKEDVVRCDLKDDTVLTLLPETMSPESAGEKRTYGIFLKAYAQITCNLFELFRLPVPADMAKASLYVQYHREIRWVREKLRREPDTAVIAFLQPAIPIVMLAARGLPNRVVFSERCDADRLMKKRYGRKFIEKYYRRADGAVFQSVYARDAYPAAVAGKGVVIFNPLKPGLPPPYKGERDKRVVTFCRISKQKNLPLLIAAFESFYRKHPEYTLEIIGDSPNEEGRQVEAEIGKQIAAAGLQDAVRLLPFCSDVHGKILSAAMYVNSSDFEGMSNAMLEAMAIGLPCVCTDCPAGGARTAIKNEENGLLVPMNDPDALFAAMNRLAEDPAFSLKLSQNAAEFREELMLDKISEKWMKLL